MFFILFLVMLYKFFVLSIHFYWCSWICNSFQSPLVNPFRILQNESWYSFVLKFEFAFFLRNLILLSSEIPKLFYDYWMCDTNASFLRVVSAFVPQTHPKMRTCCVNRKLFGLNKNKNDVSWDLPFGVGLIFFPHSETSLHVFQLRNSITITGYKFIYVKNICV